MILTLSSLPSLNLSSANLIGYDVETYDPYLKEDGPGWGRGVGYVLGVAIAVDNENKWYLPLGKNPSPRAIQWLKDTLETDIPKVGANLQYDMGWLSELGIYPKGLNMDIQFAEALLDDIMIYPNGKRRSFSLDALALDYLGISKSSTEIEAYCRDKWPWIKDFREKLYEVSPYIVGKYAVDDAALPIRIIKAQWRNLALSSLTGIFELECRLLPLLVKMRRRGLPIDENKALETRDEMVLAEQLMKHELNRKAGFELNVNSSTDLAILFDKLKVPYEYTSKGNPSFTANFLSSCSAPIATEILNLRKLIKARGTFIENAILDKAINGKIFPSLHPLRNDESGTISGRFSCSQPNGQQIPKRDAEWAPIIRGIFCPEDGYPLWATMDLSQIEYRFFAHFTNDDKLINQYRNRNTDFHEAVGRLIGENIPRIAMKTINFGLLYGMGKTKLAYQLIRYFPDSNNPKEQALDLFDQYQKKFPAAQRLLKYYSKLAAEREEVETILGRKSRFKLWEENKPGGGPAYLRPIAYSKWGSNIRVANTYKAINRVLQGSAADLMKKGMVDAYEAGIFDEIGYPHITVHDELDFSYHPDLHKGFIQLKECVENCIKLRVPVIMGLELGENWGNVS